jgi:hypothetical protein
MPEVDVSRRFRVARDLAFRVVEGEVFAVSRDNRFHVVDAGSGGELFLQAETMAHSVDEFIDFVKRRFDGLPDDDMLRGDIEAFVRDLVEKGLFESE